MVDDQGFRDSCDNRSAGPDQRTTRERVMIKKTAFVRRTVAAISVPTTLLTVALGSTAPASADTPSGTQGEIVQRASDSSREWTVPVGTNSVHLHIVGASGADGASGSGSPGGQGGHGGIVDETVAVKAGQSLQLLPGSA